MSIFERFPETQSVAEGLVAILNALHARYVFGVSGANIEHLHDAIFRLGGSALRSVLCKSEVGAAFMADSYARHGQPFGVCCATSGGGAMNLAVGIAESRASGIPVLGIVGCPPRSLLGNGAFQDACGGRHQVDSVGLWRAVSKHVVVLTAECFWDDIAEALNLMVDGHPGPAVVLLHRDVAEQTIAPCPPGWLSHLSVVPKRVGVDASNIELRAGVDHITEQYRDRLLKARRPLLIVGPSLTHCEALIQFVERHQIPVATTLEATAAFPQQHPNYVGVVGVAGHPSAHDYAINADFILVLGNGLDVMTRAPIAHALQTIPILVVHTNTDSVPEFEALQALSTSAVGWMQRLEHDTRCLPTKPRTSDGAQWLKPCAHEIRWAQSEQGCDETESEQLSNTLAIRSLSAFTEYFDQILMDAGNCAATAAHQFFLPAQVSSMIALGMGGMGYAVCGAIGAQLAQPQRFTLALVGDGAMLMLGSELHTAIELGLPVLWVVFNDSQHGMCTTRQRVFFDGRVNCTHYSPVDFCGMINNLAGDNAVWTGTARTQEEVSALIGDYLQQKVRLPGLLELKITREEVPPFFPLMQTAQVVP